MEKMCKQCGEKFEVTDEDLKFLEKISPVFDGRKFSIPVSDFCHDCKHQRHLSFRNERKLYARKCDLTDKQIISTYSPDKAFKVYDQEAWWSDKWDELKYGRDFDFSKTFAEQFKALYRDVPHMSLYTTNCENSYYTNYALEQKNCYLMFGAAKNEDCMYGKFVSFSKDCVDNLTLYAGELCYQGIASDMCYACKFFVNCRNCSDSIMIEDCQSCRNCIGCFGLRAKEFCVFNKQYSQEEYAEIKKEYEYLTNEKIEVLRGKLEELKKTLPHVSSHIFGSENCTGESVYNCKNCTNSFDSKNSEDCDHVYFTPNSFGSRDITFCSPDGVRSCYSMCSTVGLEMSMMLFYAWYGSNVYYSMECHHCHNIFGCVGLRNKKYCVFNKQYSKEEYEVLVSKIIQHMGGIGRAHGASAQVKAESGFASSSETEPKNREWGEFFPYDVSAFAYNETIAHEYYPLSKDQALKLGCAWRDEKIEMASEGDYFVPPADIREVGDDICEKILKCEVTGKAYKVIPSELKFYKKMKLPIPRICPDQRHFDRLKFHNYYRLCDRKCAKCGKDVKSVYAPGRPEIVYCEDCYLKEVY